ncbi:MAG: DUF1638 domain-containing protein [Actinomycetota bacterium]
MDAPQVLILACGALATEIRDITRLNELENVTLECLPGILHNRPTDIPDAVRARLDRARGKYDRILLGYADCGTAGELHDIAAEEGIEMLPGAHCYQFFAGQQVFDDLHNNDPTAFYLTDYLVKHFDRLIMDNLGITEHPQLRDMYFGNYTKMIYLAQTDSAALDAQAEACADKLGLAFERVQTTYGDLEPAVVHISTTKETA